MTAEPISWATAERIAARIARRDVFATSYLRPSFDSDFGRLTVEAERLVAAETGLTADGPARVRIVERDGWVTANIQSFRRILSPLTDKLGSSMNDGPVTKAGRLVTGTQLGVLLGWMSGRILGQYVPVLDEDSRSSQDQLYYVAPNILAMEKRYAFPPEEFRLWIALHECTHRSQFTGVPWMAPYLRSLMDKLIETADAQTMGASLDGAVKEILSKRKEGKSADMVSMLASPEQQDTIKRLQGLMALLEGHAEVVMSRAGADRLPNVDRFHRVIETRRKRGNPAAKLIQKALGLDAKMRQYAEGAKFVRALEAAGGAEMVALLWRSSDDLPLYEEILEPSKWIERHSAQTPA